MGLMGEVGVGPWRGSCFTGVTGKGAICVNHCHMAMWPECVFKTLMLNSCELLESSSRCC